MKRNRKWKIPHTLFERQTSCFSSYKNRELKVNCDELELTKEKMGHLLYCLLSPKESFLTFVFFLDV